MFAKRGKRDMTAIVQEGNDMFRVVENELEAELLDMVWMLKKWEKLVLLRLYILDVCPPCWLKSYFVERH